MWCRSISVLRNEGISLHPRHGDHLYAYSAVLGQLVDLTSMNAVKSPFPKAREQRNGKMELGNGSVRMTSGTQIKGLPKKSGRDVEVEVFSVSLATKKFRGS